MITGSAGLGPPWSITVRDPAGVTRVLSLAGKDEITVGRSAGNDVVLDHPAVSRNHLTIRRQGAGLRRGGFRLQVSPEARNPVLIRGRPFKGGLLRGRTELAIGPVLLTISLSPSGSRALVPWALWFGLLAGLVCLIVLIRRSEPAPTATSAGPGRRNGEVLSCTCSSPEACRASALRFQEQAGLLFRKGALDPGSLLRARALALRARCVLSLSGEVPIVYDAVPLLKTIETRIASEKRKAALALEVALRSEDAAAALEASERLLAFLGPDENQERDRLMHIRAKLTGKRW